MTADDMKMATRPRARTLFGDWLLEASVLVAVFPIIDQLVVEATFRWRPVLLSLAFSLFALSVGVYFKSEGGAT